MRTIRISGPIVDASYDNDFWMESIARGEITPSSYVIRKLYQAEKAGEDVLIEVSSPGGDALAAGDIAIALKKYKGGQLTIELGAFVASAACNLVLLSGRPITCNENTIMLAHSTWASGVAGGPSALRDEADILDKINKPVIDALIAYGVPEDKVREGFQEGRILTFDAKELLQYGIVQSVDGIEAPKSFDREEDTDMDNKKLEEFGVMLTAFEKKISELEATFRNANRPIADLMDACDTFAQCVTPEAEVKAEAKTEESVDGNSQINEVKAEVKSEDTEADGTETVSKSEDTEVKAEETTEVKAEETNETASKEVDTAKIVAVMADTPDLHSQYAATKQGKQRLDWLVKHPGYRG